MNFKRLIVLICFFFFPANLSAETVSQAHTQVDLISDVAGVRPGAAFWVGLRMRMDEGWHVYWKNPGDSGLAPSIAWKLPPGFSAGDIQWPYPTRISVGPLTSFGYEHEVILWSKISVPASFTDEKINITAKVNWLTCQVPCIPGQAELNLVLPAAAGIPEKNREGSEALEKSRRLWPVAAADWKIRVFSGTENFVMQLSSGSRSDQVNNLVFFPGSDQLIEHAASQDLVKDSGGYRLVLSKSHLLTQLPSRFTGILVQSGSWDEAGHRALTVNIPVETAASRPESAGGPPKLSLSLACLFAFIGGLILNLMPCVLPVLSLKVMGLVKSAHNRRKILVSGFLFALGVLTCFWALAAALIILQSAGHQFGWGFQFQSPVFVTVIAGILSALALNLFGVYEIGVSLTSLNQGVSSSGYWGSFLSGVLATVVATPCTAPYMGSAIGFALTQPAWVALLIFTFLGLGMACPYLLLCIFPEALVFIPKPGRWMIGLKAVLGFLLLACVVWLAWVLGLQKGMEAVIVLVLGLGLTAVGLWLWGFGQRGKGKSSLRMLAFLLGIGGFLVAAGGTMTASAPQSVTVEPPGAGNIAWQKFSPELLSELRSQKKPVLIDFTAAWCLTCQVNDRLVFQNSKVVQAFRDLGIIGLKADWTNHDEDITRTLAGYGKDSIPLYVLYGSRSDAPVIFPELVTPQLVVDLLQQQLKKR